MQPDPLSQLEEWGRETERRVGREHRVRRIRRALWLPGRVRRTSAGHWLLALLLVAGMAGALWHTRSDWGHWGARSATAYPKASHPAGAFATTTASARPTGPFEGTPAATYPKAEAGLTMPEPTELPGWSKAQVSDALGQVRAALIAMYVDRRVLVDHDPSTLLLLLAPQAREYVQEMFRDPTHRGSVVMIPSNMRLLAEPPRISGRTTVQTAAATPTDMAHLAIITNYVYVYPFDVPNEGPGSRLVVYHGEITWKIYRPTAAVDPGAGLWMGDSHGYDFGMDCAQARQGWLAPQQRRSVAGASPDRENPNSYYAPDHTLAIGNDCN